VADPRGVRGPLDGAPGRLGRRRVSGVTHEHGQRHVAAQLPVPSPPELGGDPLVHAELGEQPVPAVSYDRAGHQ
jgi:hypothetical protein